MTCSCTRPVVEGPSGPRPLAPDGWCLSFGDELQDVREGRLCIGTTAASWARYRCTPCVVIERPGSRHDAPPLRQ